MDNPFDRPPDDAPMQEQGEEQPQGEGQGQLINKEVWPTPNREKAACSVASKSWIKKLKSWPRKGMKCRRKAAKNPPWPNPVVG
jgi:hypothetical protein